MVHPLGFSVMFMSGGKFYVFNRLSWSLEQICTLTLLDDIMSVIKDKGMWGLEWKMIQGTGVCVCNREDCISVSE